MPSLIIDEKQEMSVSMIEAYRSIRTNIQFCGRENKVLLFSSCVPDEGKSTVSFLTAKAFAENGKSVLFIDTDIRRSVLVRRHHAATVDNSKIVGLSHFLSGQQTIDKVIYETNISNLYMLYSGPNVPNSKEIIDTNRFKELIASARNNFDYVIIDSAPITASIDSTIIARECDGAIMVLVPELNNKKLVKHCIKQLESSGVKILGVVMNKVKSSKNSYYGEYYNTKTKN